MKVFSTKIVFVRKKDPTLALVLKLFFNGYSDFFPWNSLNLDLTLGKIQMFGKICWFTFRKIIF